MKFIRNYGNQKALIAGLLGVKKIGCDCVVSIDADLQQDENVIETFIDEYHKGADIVSGIRNDRKTDSFFKKYTALCFYKLMNLLGVKIPPVVVNNLKSRFLFTIKCKKHFTICAKTIPEKATKITS